MEKCIHELRSEFWLKRKQGWRLNLEERERLQNEAEEGFFEITPVFPKADRLVRFNLPRLHKDPVFEKIKKVFRRPAEETQVDELNQGSVKIYISVANQLLEIDSTEIAVPSTHKGTRFKTLMALLDVIKDTLESFSLKEEFEVIVKNNKAFTSIVTIEAKRPVPAEMVLNVYTNLLYVFTDRFDEPVEKLNHLEDCLTEAALRRIHLYPEAPNGTEFIRVTGVESMTHFFFVDKKSGHFIESYGTFSDRGSSFLIDLLVLQNDMFKFLNFTPDIKSVFIHVDNDEEKENILWLLNRHVPDLFSRNPAVVFRHGNASIREEVEYRILTTRCELEKLILFKEYLQRMESTYPYPFEALGAVDPTSFKPFEDEYCEIIAELYLSDLERI